jgi:acyl dehydratase
MRLNLGEFQRQAHDLEMAGIPAARIGPSPGFDELKWLKPVFAGDTISFETEIIARKPSRSRPEWGLISIRNLGRNDAGDVVISFIAHVFVERRSTPATGA